MTLTTSISKTFIALVTAAICSCTANNTTAGRSSGATGGDDTAAADSSAGAFSADSAYAYLEAQTLLGPRVPGTSAHSACAEYISRQLVRFGADTVVVQRAELSAYNGDKLPMTNIMGRYNPGAGRRILILAHWDTRPWADNAADSTLRHTPIDGANDGASGAAVMLEIARRLGEKSPQTGVDLLFVDAEDYGRHADDKPYDGSFDHDPSWAMGTQYWAASNPYAGASLPDFAILLDMVGGKNARFMQEYFSVTHAPAVVNKVWARAAKLGMAGRFPAQVGGAVTDDHIYINKMGIPAIDIIEIGHPATGSFNPTWHTTDDNISNIDRATLGAVGTLVLDVIYNP